MKRTISRRGAIASLAAILLAPLASAQTAADALPDDLLDCAEQQDVLRRLACYDREIAKLRETPATAAAADAGDMAPPRENGDASPAPDGVPEPAQAAPAAATAAAAAETLPAPRAVPVTPPEPAAETPRAAPAAKESRDDDRQAQDPGEISATVVEISRRPRGEMIILLDNKQIWEQKHADTRFRLAVGDMATIRRSAFGGYRLFGAGNRSIQVERVQ